jgi:hypothetical protein
MPTAQGGHGWPGSRSLRGYDIAGCVASSGRKSADPPLKVWNWLEFEMRSPDEPEPPKRASKRS